MRYVRIVRGPHRTRRKSAFAIDEATIRTAIGSDGAQCHDLLFGHVRVPELALNEPYALYAVRIERHVNVDLVLSPSTVDDLFDLGDASGGSKKRGDLFLVFSPVHPSHPVSALLL